MQHTNLTTDELGSTTSRKTSLTDCPRVSSPLNFVCSSLPDSHGHTRPHKHVSEDRPPFHHVGQAQLPTDLLAEQERAHMILSCSPSSSLHRSGPRQKSSATLHKSLTSVVTNDTTPGLPPVSQQTVDQRRVSGSSDTTTQASLSPCPTSAVPTCPLEVLMRIHSLKCESSDSSRDVVEHSNSAAKQQQHQNCHSLENVTSVNQKDGGHLLSAGSHANSCVVTRKKVVPLDANGRQQPESAAYCCDSTPCNTNSSPKKSPGSVEGIVHTATPNTADKPDMNGLHRRGSTHNLYTPTSAKPYREQHEQQQQQPYSSDLLITNGIARGSMVLSDIRTPHRLPQPSLPLAVPLQPLAARAEAPIIVAEEVNIALGRGVHTVGSSAADDAVPAQTTAMARLSNRATSSTPQRDARAMEATETAAGAAASHKLFEAHDVATEEDDDEEVCCICLDGYTNENPRVLSRCRHHFHLPCVLSWKYRCNTCPMCNMDTLQDVDEMLTDTAGQASSSLLSASASARVAVPPPDTSGDAEIARLLQEKYKRRVRRRQIKQYTRHLDGIHEVFCDTMRPSSRVATDALRGSNTQRGETIFTGSHAQQQQHQQQGGVISRIPTPASNRAPPHCASETTTSNRRVNTEDFHRTSQAVITVPPMTPHSAAGSQNNAQRSQVQNAPQGGPQQQQAPLRMQERHSRVQHPGTRLAFHAPLEVSLAVQRTHANDTDNTIRVPSVIGMNGFTSRPGNTANARAEKKSKSHTLDDNSSCSLM